MNRDSVFAQWRQYWVPVTIKLDKNGNKDVTPSPWKAGQTYSDKAINSKNSVALRTGHQSVNVIDVDTKELEKLTEPWKTWVETRLSEKDCLIVETANGYHFYIDTGSFHMRSTTKTGANKSKVPYIDFRGEGGLIFIHSDTPGVSYNSIGTMYPYRVSDDILALLPPYNERNETKDDLVKSMLSLSLGTMKKEELEDLFKYLSPNVDYTTWWQWLASAYNLAINKKEAYEVCLNWSKGGDTFTQSAFDKKWKQFENNELGMEFRGGTLVQAAKDAEGSMSEDEVSKNIEKLTDEEENSEFIDGVISDIDELIESKDEDKAREFGKDFATGGYIRVSLATPELTHDEAIDVLVKKFLALNKAVPASKKPGFGEVKLRKALDALHSETVKKTLEKIENEKQDEVIHKQEERGNILGLTADGKYHFCVNDKFQKDIAGYVVEDMLLGTGLKVREVEVLIGRGKKAISAVVEKPSYLIESEFKASIQDKAFALPEMVVERNPLYGYLNDRLYNDGIINEFFENVWAGKLEKLIRLIGLTIKFKETKLNRLMLIAPSNAGKSQAAMNMKFQKFGMSRLVSAMEGHKGVGKSLLDGLKASGLLLVDEANNAIPNTLKEMDKYIQLDQFGQGGTQEIEVLFTLFTSTHGAATRTTSDELSNRFMQLELLPSEMKHTITEGRYYKEDKELYSKVITSYSRHLLISTIHSDAHKSELFDLQEEFTLQSDNDLDEILYDSSVDFINYVKAGATEDKVHAHIKKHHDEYFMQKKSDIYQFFSDRLKASNADFDHLKYAEYLTNHFVAGKKDIRVATVKKRYLKLELVPVTRSEEERLLGLIDAVVEENVEDIFDE